MKEKKNTEKKFQIYRVIAIIFTILYFITCCILKLAEVVDIPEQIGFPIYLWNIFLPVLILLSWHMCIERYWNIKFQTEEKQGDKKTRKQAGKSIIIMALLGIVVFYSLLWVVTYISMYWKYLKNLYDCILLLLVIAACWILCWRDCIKKRNIIGDGEKKYKKFHIWVFVVLILASIISIVYTYNRGETEWFNELTAEYERNQMK